MDAFAALLHYLFEQDRIAHPAPALERLFRFFRSRGLKMLPPAGSNKETS